MDMDQRRPPSVNEIESFLGEVKQLPPEMQAQERQMFFDARIKPFWIRLELGDQRKLQAAFGGDVKYPPTPEEQYRMDVKARGQDPNKPEFSGGGARPLGATLQDVGRNPLDIFYGGQVPSGKPDDLLGSMAEGMLDPVGWAGGAIRGLDPRFISVALGRGNELFRGSVLQALKKAAEWGTMGSASLAMGLGRGLGRIGQSVPGTRIPFRPRPEPMPPAAPPAPPIAPPTLPMAGSAGDLGVPPRPRFRYGPEGLSQY